MKKIVFFITLYLLPLFIGAQSVENKEINPFTGGSISATSWSNIDGKYLLPNKGNSTFYFMLRKEDNTVFFHLKIYNRNINRINKDSQLQLKMRDGSLITLTAIDTFIANTDVYTNLGDSYSRNIIHVVYRGDLSGLIGNNLIERISIDTIWGVLISELNEKNAKKVNKAYNLIMEN
ncbi:MAG: hypothetical protein E6767_17245 [Dysgonomonas sp.]|nr:hypothetical protein [Dysgonomonas sp.]